MALLSGYERRKKTVADANGDHKLISEWTHPSSIEFDGNYTLAESTKYLTQAEYDALSEEEQKCGIEYIITDAEISSSAIEYDNTTSKLNATDMQEAIDEIALPAYTEASSLTALKSGESIKTAFSKLSKAVSSYISHLADTVSHITSAERTKWNGYESSIATNTTAISSLNSDIDSLNTDMNTTIKKNDATFSVPLGSEKITTTNKQMINGALDNVYVGNPQLTNIFLECKDVVAKMGEGLKVVDILAFNYNIKIVEISVENIPANYFAYVDLPEVIRNKTFYMCNVISWGGLLFANVEAKTRLYVGNHSNDVISTTVEVLAIG